MTRRGRVTALAHAGDYPDSGRNETSRLVGATCEQELHQFLFQEFAVRRVARRGVENPWAYPADGLWARGYAATVALNHVRKFLRYYPRPTDTGF